MTTIGLRRDEIGGEYKGAGMEGAALTGFIKGHAAYHYRKMTAEGFIVEFDEILGEFGLLYAQASGNWSQAKSNATFETYMFRCFEHRAFRMRSQLTKLHKTFCQIDLDAVYRDHDSDTEATAAAKESFCASVDGLLPVDKLIIGEFIGPSQAVTEAMKSLERVGNNGPHVSAICRVHGLTESQINWALKKFRASDFFVDNR